jgi:hypothetical protein
MSENINQYVDTPSEDGNLFNTQIPSLSEDANIQDALKYYHYGTTIVPSSNSAIINQSIAGHLKALSDDITIINARGLGSDYGTTFPATPDDGYVFVKSDSVSAVFENTRLSAIYDETEPTTNLSAGMLWVDPTSSPLTMYVWSGTEWRALGA